MKINKILGLATIVFLAACADDSKFPGFDETESGLYYQITNNGSQDKVEIDDIITLDLKYMTDDTILYNSEEVPFPTQLRVGVPAYAGDVMEGMAMMNVGDEAVFKTPADSFFTVIAKVDRPEFVPAGAYLTFEVKINKAQTYEELTAEKQAEASENAEMEAGLIAAYLEENSIEVEPTESGLFFVETAAGSGQAVERGSLVKVHYIGRLLNGEKFDASYDRGEPIEFTLGAGHVIPGWDEGIGYMSVGSKATLIIPSNLAYGDSPPPGSIIEAYSPLVFDVELIEVN